VYPSHIVPGHAAFAEPIFAARGNVRLRFPVIARTIDGGCS
jgi:hypothetical protein